MRPAESYRAQRRNSRSHKATAKKMYTRHSIELWKDKWDCFPEIKSVQEGRRTSSFGVR